MWTAPRWHRQWGPQAVRAPHARTTPMGTAGTTELDKRETVRELLGIVPTQHTRSAKSGATHIAHRAQAPTLPGPAGEGPPVQWIQRGFPEPLPPSPPPLSHLSTTHLIRSAKEADAWIGQPPCTTRLCLNGQSSGFRNGQR